jgi:S1-C subfamily serine protease
VHLNSVDWIALAAVAVSALIGLRRGLVVSALSLAGLVGGAYAGSRIGPHLLHGGAASPWTPVAGLACAVFGAVVLQAVAAFAGSFARGGLHFTPLRLVDSLGGLVLGAAAGLVLVWVAGAVALLVPGQTSLRSDVRESSFVNRIEQAYPPDKALHLLARIDPYPSIAGPAAPLIAPPTPGIAEKADVRRAFPNVVRVLGRACGVGVEGTGWYAGRTTIVTAAHVVAGERTTDVEVPTTRIVYRAHVVAFDAHDDIAVLRVEGATAATPLRLAGPVRGSSVAIVGYPENGPLQATPGRIGATQSAITQDAYGNGPVTRRITTLSGTVRHGDSGAPAVDARGRVQATVFAARVGASGGYGVPASVVRRVLRSAGAAPVSTGACAP